MCYYKQMNYKIIFVLLIVFFLTSNVGFKDKIFWNNNGKVIYEKSGLKKALEEKLNEQMPINVSTQTQEPLVDIDKNPEVVIVTPFDKQTIYTSVFWVKGTATPGNPKYPIESVYLKVDNGTYNLCNGTTRWSNKVTIVSTGPHIITVKAITVSGKYKETSINIFRGTLGFLRFMVTADPQFELSDPNEGWYGTYTKWSNMVDAMQIFGAKYNFVCGDIFEGPSGMTATYCSNHWDRWDLYVSMYTKRGLFCEWTIGGHAFYSSTAYTVYLNRYGNHHSYVIEDGNNVFILYDLTHVLLSMERNYGIPTSDGVAWLQTQLQTYQGKNIFIFAHTPPRYGPDYFSVHDVTNYNQVYDNLQIELSEFNLLHNIGLLLEQYRKSIKGMFFGHEHSTFYLGDHLGFPIFEVFNEPLIVEVNGTNIKFGYILDYWINNPTITNKCYDPFDLGPSVTNWRAVALPPGEPDPTDVTNIDPYQPYTLTNGSNVYFQDLISSSNIVDVSSVSNIVLGGKILLVTTYSNDLGAKIMFASSLPYRLYIDGYKADWAKTPLNTYHFLNDYYNSRWDSAPNTFNKVVLIMDVTTNSSKTFSYRKGTGPGSTPIPFSALKPYPYNK